MPSKDTISVRLDPDLNDRITKISKEKGMTFSDALRYALKFGLERIERGHDVLEADRFMEYMHDLLRYVIKIDLVLQRSLVRQQYNSREALEAFYQPIMTLLEKRGFKKPLIQSKEESKNE